MTDSRDSHQLLPEQQAVLDEIRSSNGSFLIECPAGGAKTFLLVKAPSVLPLVPILLITFNKRNQVDAEKRMPGHVSSKTFNALGHSAWMKVCGGKVSVNVKKSGELATAAIKAHKLSRECWATIREAIDGARTLSMIPSKFTARSSWGGPIDFDLLSEWIDEEIPLELRPIIEEQLCESILLAYKGQIDFNDQIYMSCCFGGIFPRFGIVLVDEAQDLSAANMYMLSKIASGRVIAVGDRYQGIYGFRGASTEAIPELISKFGLKTLTADTTFRCASKIVELARARHPRISGFRKIEGKVTYFAEWTHQELGPETAILCRNNAPLMGIALKLLREGRGANFIGGDLSKGLGKILSQLGPDDLPSQNALEPLRGWRDKEVSKADDKGSPQLISRITDKYECLVHVLEHSDNVGEAKAKLFAIFQPNASPLTLCTIHKSKGFEWTTVVLLDPWRIPSGYAKREAELGNRAQLEQEMNLKYVAITRAKDTLIFANLDQFKGASHV